MADLTLPERLTALRDRLERLLEDQSDGTKVAALSREYRAVLAELEKLGGAKAGSAVDDLGRKRAQRIAEAAGSEPAAVRKRGRGPGGDRPS